MTETRFYEPVRLSAPTQTLVFTKNTKMPNLVEVIVIQGLPVF